MKKLLLSITALGLILFCGLTVATAEKTRIAEDALASTVFLQMDSGYGSGFLVAPGRVATNLHVIHNAITGTARLVNQTDSIKIEGYTAIDFEQDLIILDVPDLDAPPLPLGDSEDVKIGETVYAVGNPKEFEGTFSEGNISGIRKDANGELLQITAPISPGSSGGPVLNKNGKVIGVSVASGPGQNLNFAIPAKYLKTLIKKQKKTDDLSNVKKMQGFVADPNGKIILHFLGPYPSYSFVLVNSRRQDLMDIECSITFRDEKNDTIGSDVFKVPKISAWDTLHVIRHSIFEYEGNDREKPELMRLKEKHKRDVDGLLGLRRSEEKYKRDVDLLLGLRRLKEKYKRDIDWFPDKLVVENDQKKKYESYNFLSPDIMERRWGEHRIDFHHSDMGKPFKLTK